MKTLRPKAWLSAGSPDLRSRPSYLVILAVVALVYFGLAKAGLALASLHPSASPIWPPTGFALAALLLWGTRLWPAILLAAFAANVTTAGSIGTSLAIAGGNCMEAVLGAYLVNRWSQGCRTFETPAGVARFAALSVLPTLVSASVGVGSLALAGFASAADIAAIWMTWWVGDLAGAIVVTPFVVLWGLDGEFHLGQRDAPETGALFASAAVIGLVALSPLVEQSQVRNPLAFLTILPLLWAALRRGPRDTATVAFILSGFAVWGIAALGGPFARTTLNESFLLVLVFVISTSLPSLMLSADVAVRRRSEDNLRKAHSELDARIEQRTRALEEANSALQAEIERTNRAEAELRQQSVHLRDAQRLANLGNWVWDISTNKVTWSDQLFAIFGVRPDEFGRSFEDFLSRIAEEDRDAVKAEIMRAYQTGTNFRLDERIVRPSGEIRHLQSLGEVIKDETGVPVRMLGICQDVTEQKRVETALRESEKRYRMIVDNVRDHAIFMLNVTGHVVSWNAGAARIKGYAAEEIVGEHFGRFYTSEDLSRGVPHAALAAARQTGKYEAEGWRVRKDGSRFWASVVIGAIHDDTGALVGFAKVTRDFTERRQAQVELEQAREQLAQSQKMEALGQLTGGIAHDFNNLLMIVSGHAQVLRRRITDAKLLRGIEAIHSAASRGESLTRQLLGFSRRQPVSPEVIDLAARIQSVREMLGSSLRDNIELVYDCSPDAWPVRIDGAEFDLALVNMAVNARDAMQGSGRVNVSVRNVNVKPSAELGGLSGDFVTVAMSDTGTGIAPNHLPRIFEPFFTTKPLDKGTGLGLSQVYGFARQSGGHVTVSSEPGKGTTITLYLPRSHETVAARADAGAVPAAAHGHGVVLVVEDNREVAETATSLLEQLGYQVARAESASEALSRLARGEKFSLVFSDIVMSGDMDGIALAREVRLRYPAVPILLTSGYSHEAQLASAEAPILRKPYQIGALDQAIREALSAGPTELGMAAEA